jgi:hypothetical protein
MSEAGDDWERVELRFSYALRTSLIVANSRAICSTTGFHGAASDCRNTRQVCQERQPNANPWYRRKMIKSRAEIVAAASKMAAEFSSAQSKLMRFPQSMISFLASPCCNFNWTCRSEALTFVLQLQQRRLRWGLPVQPNAAGPVIPTVLGG